MLSSFKLRLDTHSLHPSCFPFFPLYQPLPPVATSLINRVGNGVLVAKEEERGEGEGRGREEEGGAGRDGDKGVGGEQGGLHQLCRAQVPGAGRQPRRQALGRGAPARRCRHRRRARPPGPGHLAGLRPHQLRAGLKRDPIVILRIDGEDLKEFVESPRFEPEAIAIFSQVESANEPLHKCLTVGLQQLRVEHGMPPASDSWVISNIVEPALQSLSPDRLEQPASQEIFLEEFKKLLNSIIQHLRAHPIIVAHSENTFDGSGIKRLLSNKFELEKLLDSVWRDLPKDHHQKTSKDYLRVALDGMASSAGLPPYGAVDQVGAIVNDAFKMVNADDGKIVDEAEFKKTLTEILGSLMLQLEGNPISVSSNSVVHGPLESSSTLFPPSSLSSSQSQGE